MIQQTHAWQCICDIDDCQALGPAGEDRDEVIREAEAVGWQTLLDLCICPACSEAGRLPEVGLTTTDAAG